MKQLLKWKKEYGTVILIGVLALLVFANAAFSYRDLLGLVPMTRTCNQLPYQTGYPEEGAYPGALLPLMVSGKTIYTRDDIRHFEFDMSDPVAPWELYLGEIYYGINARNLLKAFGADVVADERLNEITLPEGTSEKCMDLGYSNDLYRYSFAVNDIPEEYGNYFHYYYYYTANGVPMHIYLGANDLSSFTPDGEGELYAIWKVTEGGPGEDLYLFDRDFYEKEVTP
ncbi:MAG: hypothetical protein K6E16_04970 [Lachnospiraceae bacterium]|nr:hypothetical protein [Lachnospiraceae bacterium]